MSRSYELHARIRGWSVFDWKEILLPLATNETGNASCRVCLSVCVSQGASVCVFLCPVGDLTSDSLDLETSFLARDTFVRTNCRAIAIMFVRTSVCLSGTGVHCDHMVHVSADSSLWLDSAMFWALRHQSMSTYSQPSLSSSTWKRGGVWVCKLGSLSPAGICERES